MLNNLRLNPTIIFNNDFQSQELKHTVIKGSLALLLSQGMSFGLSTINTLVLARLLTPADFGIIGMVTVIINFVGMFKDAGLSTATVQIDKIEKNQISTLFWINTFISLALGFTILLSSPLVALFYKKPELTAVTAILSFSFIIQGFTIQHNALLQRHLNFTILAINEIIGQLIMMVVAIAMAYFGFRYWALVGGTVARSVVLLLLTFYSCPWIPGKMQKGTDVRNMLKFGGHLTGSNFINYLSRNLDSLLIGKFIGAEPLGLYSRAFTLLMQPLVQVRAPLTTLSLPVLSSLKKDPVRYLSFFQKLVDISISLSLPVSVYCFLESEFLIRILLGPQWMDAESVFKILSIAGFFIALSVSPGLVMLSYGFSKRYLRLNVLTALITSVSFVAGIPFGIKGVSIAYAVSSALTMIPLIYYSFRDTPIKMKLIFESISGPVFASLVAGISTYIFIQNYSKDDMSKHIIICLIFLITYITVTILRPKTRNSIKSIWESIF